MFQTEWNTIRNIIHKVFFSEGRARSGPHTSKLIDLDLTLFPNVYIGGAPFEKYDQFPV